MARSSRYLIQQQRRKATYADKRMMYQVQTRLPHIRIISISLPSTYGPSTNTNAHHPRTKAPGPRIIQAGFTYTPMITVYGVSSGRKNRCEEGGVSELMQVTGRLKMLLALSLSLLPMIRRGQLAWHSHKYWGPLYATRRQFGGWRDRGEIKNQNVSRNTQKHDGEEI